VLEEGSYIIEGTPTEVGPWTFTLIADTGDGCVESKEYTIQILSGTGGPAKSVPTASEWGLVIMALLMAGAALLVLRRKGVM
jgi:hypothetical protein